MAQPREGWAQIEVGERRPAALTIAPGRTNDVQLLERELAPGERLTLWLSGDGSAASPFVIELAVDPRDALAPRWPTLEEIRDAVAHALEGAVFTIWGTHMVAGDDNTLPGGPLVLVQGGALPGSPAAKRLELTAPGSSLVMRRTGAPS